MVKKLTRFLGLVMAVAMMLTIVPLSAFAAKAEFKAPTESMEIDDNLITMAAHSQGWITPEVLGITNTTSRTSEIPATFDATPSGLVALGVFGSDINENPNPYLYNWYYNYNVTKTGSSKALAPFPTYTLSKDVGGGPMTAAASGGYEQDIPGGGTATVCASLYLRPDILLGVDPVTRDPETNAILTTGYTNAINALYENTDDDATNNYNPYQVVYTSDHVYSFLQSMYELSDICAAITTNTGKVTRYDATPYEITTDIEKYVKGIQSYIIKQINENDLQLETVAVIDASATEYCRTQGTIEANEYVLNTKNISTQATTNYSRVAEFVADTTTNLVDELSIPAESLNVNGRKTVNAYVATADQIATSADSVVLCDVLTNVPENTNGKLAYEIRADLVEKCTTTEKKTAAENMDILQYAFDCVGSIGANSVENLLGMAYYTAYFYPQYVNQFEVAAYWYQNFYHISDLETLKSVMSANFMSSSVKSEYEDVYTPDISNYSESKLEKIIIEGMEYYEANESAFEGTLLYQNGRTGANTGWEIDWTKGIGSTTGDEITVEKAEDGNWYSYNNNKKVNYTGFATNDNGTWYVENGKVTFKKNDIIKDTDGTWKYVVGSKFTKTNTVAKNSLGWWRVENGIVNFKATGVFQNSNGWWYCKNGQVQFGYTGIQKNSNGWWRIVNGKVDFSATGVYQNELGWWYCKNGKVDFGYTGIKSNSNGWWRIVNGKVDFSANGVYQNENGWWKVENGKVNFGFTGIASNSNGRWYCVNGKVDFSKNGRVRYQGTTYNIKGGKVV